MMVWILSTHWGTAHTHHGSKIVSVFADETKAHAALSLRLGRPVLREDRACSVKNSNKYRGEEWESFTLEGYPLD